MYRTWYLSVKVVYSEVSVYIASHQMKLLVFYYAPFEESLQICRYKTETRLRSAFTRSDAKAGDVSIRFGASISRCIYESPSQ